MIVAQVVQFLFEWASTLVLAIFNPVQAAVEQAFLRALYRLILRSLLLRLLATVAAYEGLNVGLSSVMDLLVRWSLAADGKSTRYGGRYASQAAGFGAVQGAFAVFVPYVGSSIAGLLAKDIRQSIESVVGQGLAAGGLGAKSLGSKELGGEGLGGQVAVGLGRDADEAVGGSGPVGGFARDLAASVAGVAQRFEMGEVGDAVAFSFREGMGDLFARQYGHVLGGGAARALGEGWAQAFVRSFGSRELGGELFRSLGTLGAAEFQSLRSALSHGVADALSADWSRKVSGYAGDAVANAGHQNVSEGFYNLFTTGRFTTSWETGTSGAAGGSLSHLVSANAHLIGRGIRIKLGLGGTDKFTVAVPPDVVNPRPQTGTDATGKPGGTGADTGVGTSSFLITPKHDTTTGVIRSAPGDGSVGGAGKAHTGRSDAAGVAEAELVGPAQDGDRAAVGEENLGDFLVGALGGVASPSGTSGSANGQAVRVPTVGGTHPTGTGQDEAGSDPVPGSPVVSPRAQVVRTVDRVEALAREVRMPGDERAAHVRGVRALQQRLDDLRTDSAGDDPDGFSGLERRLGALRDTPLDQRESDLRRQVEEAGSDQDRAQALQAPQDYRDLHQRVRALQQDDETGGAGGEGREGLPAEAELRERFRALTAHEEGPAADLSRQALDGTDSSVVVPVPPPGLAHGVEPGSRTARMVDSPVAVDAWQGRRAGAPVAYLRTERFDPAADPLANPPREGTLGGWNTLIRSAIRRIQAVGGQWVREFTVALPVRHSGDIGPDQTAALQRRLQGVLDQYINRGYALPLSGDQLHVRLELASDSEHREGVTLTDTRPPGRADQRHWDLQHSDAVLLHEVLHYLGLPDEQRDPDFLFRGDAASPGVHQDGQMADTSRLPGDVPQRYLTTIEQVSDSGPVIRDHPLGAAPVPSAAAAADSDPGMWPVSQAPMELPVMSSFVRSYGSQRNGTVGLMYLEPMPPEMVDAVHEQVLAALHLGPVSTATAEREQVREQLRNELNGTKLALALPYLHSDMGHRISVRTGGRNVPVDVRLTIQDPRYALRYAAPGGADPDVRLEARSFGTQESSSAESSGTSRTLLVPWTGTFPITALKGISALETAVSPSVTHNQLTQSSGVTQLVRMTTSQRSNERATPYDFTAFVEVRANAPRQAPPVTWGPAREHGVLTFWFPEHLALDGPSDEPLPPAAGLDDLPVWSVETVAQPALLLEEVQERFAGELRGISDDSLADLHTFLSEPVVRGTVPMQRTGGIYSPVLLDGRGRALGMFKLTADVTPGQPIRKSVDGKISLEAWLNNTVRIEGQARLTSGVGITGSAGPVFSSLRSSGPVNLANAGSLLGRAGGQWQTSDTFAGGGTAAIMHSARSKRSHLLTPADVTYTVTLIRPDGSEVRPPADNPISSRPSGMHLRLLAREDARGHVPTPDEVRTLPPELENLRAIGLTATPIAVQGTEALFQHAEDWLRENGFLPPPPHRPSRNRIVPDEALVQARLNNLRRFEQARSEIGLRAATDSMVDGGHPIYLEKPTATGIHRIQLRLTATRSPGPDRPSRHTSTLPHINSVSNATFFIPGTEQKSQSYGGSLGLSGGPRGTVRNGSWTLAGSGEYLWSGQVSDTQAAGAGIGHDQFFISSGSRGSELFEIPAELALDLYDGPGAEPTVRFAHRTLRAPYTPYGQNPSTARRLLPDTVSGTIVVSVPHHRTLPHDAPPAEPAPYVIRAVNTAGTEDNDYIRLGMTDRWDEPLPHITQLPDDALVDTFQASTAVQEAIRQLLTDTYPGHPAQGISGAVRTFMADHVPDLVNTAARRIGETLAGQSSTDPTTVASEVLTAAVSPGALLVRAHQIFKGTYVIEGLTLPGIGSDEQFSVEIRGYLHHPEYLGSIDQYVESGLSSVDTASQQRAGARMHQGAASFTATQSAPVAHPIPADAGAGNDQETNPIRPRSEPRASGSGSDAAKGKRPLATVPSARYTSTVNREESAAVTTTTVVERTATDDGMEHRVRSGATLVVTLRQGLRSLAVNALALGAPEPRTVAVDLPRSVEFLLTDGQLKRYGKWYEDVAGLAPEKPAPAPGIPLPRQFTISQEPGLASIMSVIQYDDPDGNGFRTEWRNRLGDELVALVEEEAPGVLTPGHASYLPGVAARIADYTSTPGLRALVGRGPNGDLKLHFPHIGYGGARLVTITLSARPAGDTNALRTERGRPAGPDTGIEQFHSHQPAGITNATSNNFQQAGSVNVSLRIPRPGSDKLTDRFAGLGTALSTRTHTARDIKNVEDRYWLRSDNVVDFDLLYTITATLSVTRMTDWPPNILGAFVQNGVISAMETNADLRTWLQRTFQGRPVRRLSVPASVGLRFTGSEAAEPDTTSTPLAPRATDETPRMAGQAILPLGPVPVLDYNAAAELANALDTVAPRQAGSWRALTTSASGESTAVRLGELIQAGEISLDWPRTTNGLTTSMPGAYPFESEPGAQPVMAISLHNPRPVTMGGDVTLDRVRHNTDFAGSSVSSGTTAGFSVQGLGSLSDTNRQIVGVSVPLLVRQPTVHSESGTISGGRRNWKKIGTTSVPATGRVTRSYAALMDADITVRGPEGVRHVVGTISGRIGERDVLGFGITPPRTDPGVYDLQSMVKAAADAEAREAAAPDAAQDEGSRPAGEETPVTADAALRDWNRRPLRDLPDVLISQLDPSDRDVELWLAVDDDHRQVGRAVFTAAQTAARTGRPVTLVLRTEDRLRTWEFDGDGEPTGLDAAAATAWGDFAVQAAAFTTAAAAETDARGREIALEPRLRTAREHLDEIAPLVDPAATALTTAREREGLAEGDLSTAQQTRDQLRQNAQDLSDQVTRLVRAGAVLDDEIDRTRGSIRSARIAVRQTDSVVDAIDRRRAAAPSQPDARTGATDTPRPDEERAHKAHENLDALQSRLSGQERRSQELLEQVDIARQEAARAHTRLEEAGQAVAQAEEALREAQKEVGEAEEQHRKAVADRDAAQREVTAREEDIREARTEQTRRTTAQTAAEQRFPDLVALVEQARTAAGQDPAGIPRGSAATAPAQWPVHGRRPVPPRGVPTSPAPGRTGRQPADPPPADPANPLAVPSSTPPATPPSARQNTDDGTAEHKAGTPEQGSAGEPGDATLPREHPGTSHGVTPDSLAVALAQALRSAGVRDEDAAGSAGWTGAVDIHRALRAWARQELMLRGIPEGVRLAAGGDPVSVEKLARVGVRLTPAQHAQAVLRGDVLPVAEAGLTRGQRIDLLLGDTGSSTYADVMAALVAHVLGRAVVISGPGRGSRRFGAQTAAGAPLRLHFDGTTYSAITGSGEVSSER
ncbi:hypothetical protein [Streptomyces sp. SCL15-6]|uniref:hypothetical protein n=1 Tax=Streptomyces sp. SCL15-6 TaxID=2967222 RepID=UPI002965D6F0|nr:hypothetical protein [Streptomyces sp. SCL15-6]